MARTARMEAISVAYAMCQQICTVIDEGETEASESAEAGWGGGDDR
jgi:hypothetical protein